MASEEEVGRQIAEMSARIAALERAVGLLGRPSPVPPPPAMPPAPPVPAPPGPAAPVPLEPHTSLESRIGGQVLNRVGIFAVLAGVAWFLKLAFDRNWIGPGIRIVIGLFCAGALVVWSERFRRRGFPAFSYSLKALGTSIAYLALWAASSVYHLAPSWLVFLAMTAVTLANAALAQRQNSELLAIYALAGGLATPALLSIGAGDQLFLFAYLVLLNAGSLFLLARRPWKRLAWLALLGTATYYLGWGFVEHQASNFLLSALFLCLFFVLFSVLPLLLRPVSDERFFLIAFPIVNACATWLALSILADRQHHALLLCLTIALALISLVVARSARESVVLSRTNLGLGILFVTVACALHFHDYQLTLCWLVEGVILVALARTARENDALRVYAIVVLAVAAFALSIDWASGGSQPVVVLANMHFATSLVGAAVFATVVVLSLRAGVDKPGAFCSWRWLAGSAAIAFSLIVLVAVSLEIHHYWFCGAGFFRDLCAPHDQGGYRAIAANFSLSAWWMLYGAGLMTVGFLRRSAFLRWQALVLLALSIGKVFLNGVSLESQGLRVLSFLALGILLLAVSFAYQRNWLRLRD